jgi:hypothetical protein
VFSVFAMTELVVAISEALGRVWECKKRHMSPVMPGPALHNYKLSCHNVLLVQPSGEQGLPYLP